MEPIKSTILSDGTGANNILSDGNGATILSDGNGANNILSDGKGANKIHYIVWW